MHMLGKLSINIYLCSMRIVRILNISVIVLFFALWVILLVKKESYQGDGMIHPAGTNKDFVYFSSQVPFGIFHQGAFSGFTTQNYDGKVLATGLWKLDLKTQKVSHFPFPSTHRFDSLIAILPTPDTALTIVGLENDSVVKIINYDSLIHPGLVFTAPAPIKAAHYIKDHPEFVFGRQKNLVGSIGAVDDSTVTYRKYELPGFFDRICEIVAAWPEKDKWRFLLSTDYHKRNDKWVLIESKNKTNFLVFDERAVFPDFPGILDMNEKQIARHFDYTLCGLLPRPGSPDTVLVFSKNKFHEKTISKPESNECIWATSVGTAFDYSIVSWDDVSSESGILKRNFYHSMPDGTLPFISEDGKYVFHQQEEPDRRQIFTAENEFPIGFFRLSKDSCVFISNRLNFSFLNDEGRLLDRKNFFTLIKTTILRKEPETVTFLDGEFPTLRALTWFTLLYGLIPAWILSLVVIWLIEAIRPRPKFAVRERKWPLSMRLMPGSALYLLLYAFNIYPFLQSFSIHFF